MITQWVHSMTTVLVEYLRVNCSRRTFHECYDIDLEKNQSRACQVHYQEEIIYGSF